MNTDNKIGDEIADEISAMTSVAKALQALQPEAQKRVLEWASGRFGIQLAIPRKTTVREDAPADDGDHMQFPDFASLYDAANPQTDPERALVAGYWFQVTGGKPDLDAQPLNTALKNLGHRISNITDALSSLKSRRPALVVQTQKKGASKQGRKKYKLTTAGVRAVDAMLAPSDQGEE